ncbi:hypothetical protein Poli38472_012303 [Pythium oligandrum]|uniref:Uncharacterized protein n=1 Tax=Pythium oligandrum TaxID=41045 RepID=A0A8K1FPR9_PYTOL|nr:hypothetical protein Poli38472_012303 [Pythium oligandrum]|eukprot:TMW67187.1 hypothetical protein Poli38472_012303 [Pythium oligandrum]
MDATTKRALFQAVDDGDLDAVRAFFTLPSATEAIARSNADHRLTRETAVAEDLPPTNRQFTSRHARDCWYLYSPEESEEDQDSIFKRIIKHQQFHVLEWFFSTDACTVIGDTMCGLIYSVLSSAFTYAERMT